MKPKLLFEVITGCCWFYMKVIAIRNGLLVSRSEYSTDLHQNPAGPAIPANQLENNNTMNQAPPGPQSPHAKDIIFTYNSSPAGPQSPHTKDILFTYNLSPPDPQSPHTKDIIFTYNSSPPGPQSPRIPGGPAVLAYQGYFIYI